ncbi:PR domain zinc finger protein 13-like [Saccostrea echinata]|uniref:PR domain zinc finger protein 13-like n=1 Tax=Saccostrea echinata TaxID=191078 RepID=UPI002A80B455|nr:PR domain zinc finger protein 13-like [Saccostrea echinata]
MKGIRPARDRHEQNTEFFRSDDGGIYLRSLRRVRGGEEILVWYSDDLARRCGVPFLSLVNIQGKECYACDSCGKTFKYPNPLKAHLRYRCNDTMTQQEHKLFRPFLDSSVTGSGHTSLDQMKSGVDLRLSASAFHSPKIRTLHCPTADIQSFDVRHFPPLSFFPMSFAPLMTLQSRDFVYGKFLAPYFLPASRGTIFERSLHEWPDEIKNRQPRGAYNENVNGFKLPLPTDVEGEPLDLLPKSFFADKSQKGHLCLYCGKLYSRKYGLKIHLRTHTGYKPLKCKVCLRPFGDPSNLNKHVRLHAEGQTPYRCDHCGKILVRRRDLDRHIKSRHPNVPVKNETEDEIVVI